jgi:Undecaprenyl-phosphate galactose phosphotransferase WbaP
MAMSNVEARVAQTLSSPDGPPLRLRGTARSGAPAAQWSRQRRLFVARLLAGDVLAGAAAIVVAGGIMTTTRLAGEIGLVDWLRMEMPATLLLLIGICGLLGLYRSTTKSLMERFRLRATATLLFVFAGMLMLLREGSSVELAIIPLVGVIALVFGSWIEHLINARLRRSGVWGAPTAILGAGANSRTFARLLMSQPTWGLRPVGFIDDGVLDSDDADEASPDRDTDTVSALPLLGTIEGWRVDSGAEVVIVPDCQALPRDPNALYRLGVRQILVVNQLGEFASFGLQIRHFDRFVGLELGGRPSNPSRRLKRAIDLAVALPLALLTGPIIGLLALIIRITDPGPAFYGQQRVGRHGKPIRVLKLRTMYRDAEQRLEQVLRTDAAMGEQWRRYFKLPQDPRILPGIGNFLRRTSLDELPQLWNVIRGDMSLVGPRPFPAYHMEAFDTEFQALRVTVPPGLTGLWQISSRSDGDLGVQRAQDCFYIRNRSLWLDFYILIATLPAVLGGGGAK